MKKLLIILFTLFSITSAYSETKETITLINNGKAGGSYNARTQMYKEGLEARGFNVKYENIGKISQAVKVFKSTTEPTIMVYSNNQVHKQGLFHNPENFIMLEYQQPLYICKTNAAKNKTTDLTVAHGKGYDIGLLKNILGNNITLVPYKNSGAMLKGILGGDVDAMVNNQGKSLKYMASGQGSCEVSKDLPIMLATVIGVNVDVQKLRDIIFDISMDIKFIEYHNSKKLVRPSSTWANELDQIRKSERLWTK